MALTDIFKNSKQNKDNIKITQISKDESSHKIQRNT